MDSEEIAADIDLGNIASSAGVAVCLLLLHWSCWVCGELLSFHCCYLSHSSTNTCIYARLMFNIGVRKSTAGEPVPICTNIIMLDVDKSALLTREGVLNRQLCFTSTAVLLHLKRCQVEEEAGILLTPFRCIEDVAM